MKNKEENIEEDKIFEYMTNLKSYDGKIPDFIGTIYESMARKTKLVDLETGKSVLDDYLVHYADANAGYFVARKRNLCEHCFSYGPYKIYINKKLKLSKYHPEIDSWTHFQRHERSQRLD